MARERRLEVEEQIGYGKASGLAQARVSTVVYCCLVSSKQCASAGAISVAKQHLERCSVSSGRHRPPVAKGRTSAIALSMADKASYRQQKAITA